MSLETGVVTGWEIKKNKDGDAPVRLLQVVISDPEDVQTVEWIGQQGEDDGIIAGATVLINQVGSTKYAFAVDDGIEPAAEDGEKELYSIDSGAKVATITLKKGGELEFNGDNDYLISFSELKSILEQFAADINTELAKYELIAPPAVPVAIDITPAKTEKIRIGFP